MHSAVVLTTVAVLAWAVSGAPPQPEPDTAQPVLAGPKVDEKVARTLAHTDMQGRFRKVEARPEVAAVNDLDIEPGVRDQVRQVVEQRATTIRLHLIDHVDLVTQATSALRLGDGNTLQKLVRELYDKFDAEHQRDPLLAPLASLLSKDQAAELKRLVDEYWDAWIDSELKRTPRTPREKVRERLIVELFQNEVRSAYESTLRPYQQKIENLHRAVEPTPEQAAAIREAVVDFIREARLRATDEQRQRLARRVYDILDEDRRVKLFAAAILTF